MINIHSGVDSVELVFDWNSNSLAGVISLHIHSLRAFIIYIETVPSRKLIYDDIQHNREYFEFHLIPFVQVGK